MNDEKTNENDCSQCVYYRTIRTVLSGSGQTHYLCGYSNFYVIDNKPCGSFKPFATIILFPCPFCGLDNTPYLCCNSFDQEDGNRSVRCLNCGATGPVCGWACSDETVASQWNKRKPPAVGLGGSVDVVKETT